MKTNRVHRAFKGSLLVLFTLLILLLSSPIAADSAGQLLPLPGDIAALVLQADAVVIGQVHTINSRYVSNQYDDLLIVSDVMMSIDDVLKEAPGLNQSLTMTDMVGGVVQGIGMRSSAAPAFKLGSFAVMFLVESDQSYVLLGDTLGYFEIDQNGLVPRLGIPLEQFVVQINSFLAGTRLNLPVVTHSETSGTAGLAPVNAYLNSPASVLTGQKWPGISPIVTFHINNAGFQDADGQPVAAENLAIEAAALNTWNQAGRANFSFAFGGPFSTTTVGRDGKNMLIVRHAGLTIHRAITYWWYRVETNETIECDILFNDRPNVFSIGESAIDIQSTAATLFGFCLGLDISVIPAHTMHNVPEAGELHKRTLHLDDIGGIVSLYGRDEIEIDSDPPYLPQSNGHFAETVAIGDFAIGGRGNPDLVVGAPTQGAAGALLSGLVFVYSNTADSFSTPQVLSQEPASTNSPWDRFGHAIATGDFNGDGYDDLAVSAPGDGEFGSGFNAGSVFIFAGTTTGFADPFVVIPRLGSDAGDEFGYALAVGDFNNDDIDDLVVGSPGAEIDGNRSGQVHVFLGPLGELGGIVLAIDQEPLAHNDPGDRYGQALVVGDFNGDGEDDLVVGAPGKDYSSSQEEAGIIYLYYGPGSPIGSGPTFYRFQGNWGQPEAGDHFGTVLAAGDFNNDGYDELAVGAPDEGYATGNNAGAVSIFVGSSGVITGPITFGQGGYGNASDDHFGSAFAVADFNGDGYQDLAIGAPGKDLSGMVDTGAVYIRQFADDYGSFDGYLLQIRQADADAQAGDLFGASLVAAHFSAFTDLPNLVIGTPGEDAGASALNAGSLHYWRKSVVAP
ncbi:MAG: FG-GAP repeat protein [Anaerolineales bacterium]|nr:FG-GAP repeat protein [Anaerolineales bacterium]